MTEQADASTVAISHQGATASTVAPGGIAGSSDSIASPMTRPYIFCPGRNRPA
jgi:hypothetical protein